MESLEERPLKVEIPNHFGFQVEVKTLKRPGGVEVLRDVDSIGELPNAARVRRDGRNGLRVWDGSQPEGALSSRWCKPWLWIQSVASWYCRRDLCRQWRDA